MRKKTLQSNLYPNVCEIALYLFLYCLNSYGARHECWLLIDLDLVLHSKINVNVALIFITDVYFVNVVRSRPS